MFVIATTAQIAAARNSGFATEAEATAAFNSLRHKAASLRIWKVESGKAIAL